MFDIDGVVIVNDRPWHSQLAIDYGISPAALQHAFFDLYWSDIVVGRLPIEACLGRALAEIAPEVEAEELLSYWFHRTSRLNDPLLADIRTLRGSGHSCQCATNQEHRRARFLWNDVGLRNHFDNMHYSAEIGARKPDGEFFRAVAARAGLPPQDIFLFDDNVENVSAAQTEGWHAALWSASLQIASLMRSGQTKVPQ